MEERDLRQWLTENAGPVIRFRTVVDLSRSRDIGMVSHVLDQLLTTPVLNVWLERLRRRLTPGDVWSTSPDSLSNVMGKLVQLGMRAGLQPFDNLTLPMRAWLTDVIEADEKRRLSITREMVVVACFLAFAGYSEIKYVREILTARLGELYRQIATETYGERRPRMSLVELMGIASSEHIMRDGNLRMQAETLVEEVLDGEYGDVVPDVDGRIAPLLVALEFLPRFQAVRESTWLQRALERLEQGRTMENTYDFSEGELPERERGHWLHGDFMAYDSRESVPRATECESTFRVLYIDRVISDRI